MKRKKIKTKTHSSLTHSDGIDQFPDLDGDAAFDAVGCGVTHSYVNNTE
jgi:hypothetical protein